MTSLETSLEPSPGGAKPVEDAPVPYRPEPWWVNQRLVLLATLAILVAVFGTIKPVFFNELLIIRPLLTDISIYTVVALAQMVALSIGHMNLAVPRMAALSAMFAGISYDLWGFPFWLGLPVGLLAGALAGALAGLIIARLDINSFVVTLSLDFALLGLIDLVYRRYSDGAAFTTKPPGFDELRQYSFADVCVGNVCGSPAVPQMAIITVLTMVLLWWLYRQTRLGREILMLGSSLRAAQLSGIPTRRHIVFVHALSGTLAALAGFLLSVRNGSFTAGVGGDFMLNSFLGAVLGGTLLAGGYISIWGTALGMAIALVIRQGLGLVGVGLESLNIYLGLILLVALSGERLRKRYLERTGRSPS